MATQSYRNGGKTAMRTWRGRQSAIVRMFLPGGYLLSGNLMKKAPAVVRRRLANEEPVQTFMPRSDTVEAVQVHDLVPGCDEVTHELFRPIVLRIDLGQGAQLR